MLALVKKPRIEISIHGEHVDELLAWIKKKYDVTVLADKPEDELVSIESTEYWQEMEKNRIGNLLAGARLKAGLTQTSATPTAGADRPEARKRNEPTRVSMVREVAKWPSRGRRKTGKV